MMNKMKSSFTIHNKSEEKELDTLWGMDRYKITKRDIEALLEGKFLHTTENGEYAAMIELIEEDEDDDQ